jgi:hypothetical protein
MISDVATWNQATQRETTKTPVIGESVTLTLDILLYPLSASIAWYMEVRNTLIPLASLSNNTKKLSVTTWALTIPSVQEEDYGVYRANVTNEAGGALFTFKITKPCTFDQYEISLFSLMSQTCTAKMYRRSWG